ncbi:MAG TPA: T9SS type A sorting domain-containing protein, partial [Blastocatellia bacterium]|nr:T9SS type A sorting domain-containing protein [Blastocatellia bacterium]
SEFGRRAFENGGYSSGTDHGTAAPHFIIGSQVNAGLYGHNPDLQTLDENGDPYAEFEFRRMYASVMGDWFGVSKETTTAVLSPGRDRDPFETEFMLNDKSERRSLISTKQGGSVSRSTEPQQFRLRGNFPNPASSHTTIKFDLARSANVKLQLFDARGALLTTLINSKLTAGEHSPHLRTAELPPGSYVYRLTVDDRFETRQMSIIR